VDFDRRAGLPAGIGRQIAAVLEELVPSGGGVILDLCAGTGQIGEHLVRGRCRYLAIDVSAPMLAVFRRKLGAGDGGALVRADAGARWPIASGRTHLVFVSRAAHLLPPGVLVEETLRVASPRGALFVLGGVRSERDSLRAVLRRQMWRLLAERGVEGRNARRSQHRIADALVERGGEILAPRTAASWAVVDRAGDALAAWRAKSGLGGRAVAPEVQDDVLRRLEDWIRERYGSLDVARDATERYELAMVRLPSKTDDRPEKES
jgi:SAM-dependent methyltransferase